MRWGQESNGARRAALEMIAGAAFALFELPSVEEPSPYLRHPPLQPSVRLVLSRTTSVTRAGRSRLLVRPTSRCEQAGSESEAQNHPPAAAPRHGVNPCAHRAGLLIFVRRRRPSQG